MTQPTLWPTGPAARLTDPDPSRATISDEHLTELQARVLAVHYRHGGLTDQELCAALPRDFPPSIVKRRGELVRASVLRDTGSRRPTSRGRAAIVWGVTPTDQRSSDLVARFGRAMSDSMIRGK